MTKLNLIALLVARMAFASPSLDESDSRAIAKRLVKRLERIHSCSDPNQPFYDFYRDSELQLQFEAKNIPSIQKNGFLNQHQTKHASMGSAYVPTIRAKHEDAYIGTKLEEVYDPRPDNPIHKIRPKYAFLGLQKSLPGTSNLTGGYGNVFAVLKDDVKERTTFTPNDSANMGASSVDVKPLCYRSPTPIQQNNDASYWEAQIWGELTVSDVKYFLIHCGAEGAIQERTLKLLCAMEIPVYECNLDILDHSDPSDPTHLHYQWIITPGRMACR